MSEKAKVFIYSRKEFFVLLTLGGLVAFFAFTLGVHFGKEVGGAPVIHPPSDAQLASPAEDQLASRQDLNEQGRVAPRVAEEVLDQSLQDEVKKQGLKLDVPRQVDLPPVHKAEVPPSAASASSVVHGVGHYDSDTPALKRPAPEGVFTLQVGSFATAQEGNDQIESLDSLGLKPYLRLVNVRGKRWFRVYMGGFPSQSVADQAGSRYLKQHLIENFVVSKTAEFNSPTE